MSDAKTCGKCGGAIHPVRGCTLCPMFASGQTPTCRSDGTIFPSHLMGGRQFKTAAVRNRYLARARAAGVNTDGKVYCSSLADFPGDPRAWVDSTGEQKRLLEERGWNATGDITVKAPDAAPPPPVRLAEDLVEERLSRKLEEMYPDAENGKVVKIKKKVIERLRNDIIEKHGAPAPGTLNRVRYVRGPGGGKGKRVGGKKK